MGQLHGESTAVLLLGHSLAPGDLCEYAEESSGQSESAGRGESQSWQR